LEKIFNTCGNPKISPRTGKTIGFGSRIWHRLMLWVALTPWFLELQAIDYEGKLFDTLKLEK